VEKQSFDLLRKVRCVEDNSDVDIDIEEKFANRNPPLTVNKKYSIDIHPILQRFCYPSKASSSILSDGRRTRNIF